MYNLVFAGCQSSSDSMGGQPGQLLRMPFSMQSQPWTARDRLPLQRPWQSLCETGLCSLQTSANVCSPQS